MQHFPWKEENNPLLLTCHRLNAPVGGTVVWHLPATPEGPLFEPRLTWSGFAWLVDEMPLAKHGPLRSQDLQQHERCSQKYYYL